MNKRIPVNERRGREGDKKGDFAYYGRGLVSSLSTDLCRKTNAPQNCSEGIEYTDDWSVKYIIYLVLAVPASTQPKWNFKGNGK